MKVSAALTVTALVTLALLAFNSLTRIREFTPDSMSYVDVARNFAEGRGLSQSALGFGRASFAVDEVIPAAWTGHAPGFSIAIALLSRAGVSFENAALALAALFYGSSLVVAFFLAREVYDEAVAWLVVAVLLNYYPLRHTAAVGWSETQAVLCALTVLWLLARYYHRSRGSGHAVLVGLFTGLAFATRYPMFPLVPVAAIAIASRRSPRLLRDGALFAFGAACSAGPVLARNLAVSGTIAGAASNIHYTRVRTHMINALWALSEYYEPYYLEAPPRRLELWILLAGVLVASIALAYQRRLKAVLAETFLRIDGPRWIALWGVAYIPFIIIVRSITWFDDISDRLIVPGSVALAVLMTAFAVRAMRLGRAAVIAITGLLVATALAREAMFTARHAPVSRGVPPTPRLTWIANNTTARDLVIGDYTMDLPFYFPHRKAITFEHFPYTNRPSDEMLDAYLGRHCREFDHVYLIVHDWYGTNRGAWIEAFGSMIADLMTGAEGRHPRFQRIAVLADSSVFRVTTACVR